MTDSERIAWLETHAISSKWDHRTGWTVFGFGVTGTGRTFRQALDNAILSEAAVCKDGGTLYGAEAR